MAQLVKLEPGDTLVLTNVSDDAIEYLADHVQQLQELLGVERILAFAGPVDFARLPVEQAGADTSWCYVVCASNATQADTWRRERGVPARQVIYASSVAKIEGLRNFQVVYLDGFDERKDAEEIRASLARGRLKMAAARAVAST
ncbi:hypothetical protein OOK29_26030 [Streptomyces phaeochromogenes]|uniref:hypothetical protein n=1 Tax=Streptomyces phaeochromogenes TaxID=1923 RepID=UPI002257BE4B|nr:hypothetical protein [Streptomyces phaeochromogenes]MCX5601614.1 hypothetical protein [Streptomyces phaeochromogenes]